MGGIVKKLVSIMLLSWVFSLDSLVFSQNRYSVDDFTGDAICTQFSYGGNDYLALGAFSKNKENYSLLVQFPTTNVNDLITNGSGNLQVLVKYPDATVDTFAAISGDVEVIDNTDSQYDYIEIVSADVTFDQLQKILNTSPLLIRVQSDSGKSDFDIDERIIHPLLYIFGNDPRCVSNRMSSNAKVLTGIFFGETEDDQYLFNFDTGEICSLSLMNIFEDIGLSKGCGYIYENGNKIFYTFLGGSGANIFEGKVIDSNSFEVYDQNLRIKAFRVTDLSTLPEEFQQILNE